MARPTAAIRHYALLLAALRPRSVCSSPTTTARFFGFFAQSASGILRAMATQTWHRQGTIGATLRMIIRTNLRTDMLWTLRTGFALMVLWATAAPGFAQVITAGPRTCPGVALTFDLCPVRDPIGYDAALVNYLKDNQIPATFFISGRWATRHPDHVRALAAVPFFELGTHGDVHAHLPMHEEPEQRQEISRAVTVMQQRFGLTAPLFRPPFGEFNDLSVQVVKALGLRFILWDVVSGDPDPTLSAAAIIDRVSRKVRSGSIVVMHANGKGKHTGALVQALHESVLEQKHLRPMTVSELLACREHAQ